MGATSIFTALYSGFTLWGSVGVGALLFFTTGILSAIYFKIMQQWHVYAKYKEKEAQDIVDRLRGR